MIQIHSIPDPIIHCDFENVYSPSDDSYLLIDYFKSKIDKHSFDGIKLHEIKNILDLGTGTGIIAIFFQMIKKYNLNFNPEIYASDILEEAIKCAKKNEKLNKIQNEITFLHSNLFVSFPESLKNHFNIIIFNPPYLPSLKLIEKNHSKKDIDYSWNGGLEGYEILIDFLRNAKFFLNLEKDHYIYCITSSRTNLKALNKKIIDFGYENKIVEKRHIFFEDIFLYRLRYFLD
ncbi:MAG: methyltransferase [Candidatus Hodarchaeota archaeon]